MKAVLTRTFKINTEELKGHPPPFEHLTLHETISNRVEQPSDYMYQCVLNYSNTITTSKTECVPKYISYPNVNTGLFLSIYCEILTQLHVLLHQR